MKKKQRCLLKRFAAFVAAFMMAFALSVPAFAASETEADMPSRSDFSSHLNSWFVWRSRSYGGVLCYELTASPLSFDSSGSFTSGFQGSFLSTFYDVSVISGDDTTYYYACATPVPLHGITGSWSSLPSFPVGTGASYSSCSVCLYSKSSWLGTPSNSSGLVAFLAPAYSSSSSSVSFGASSGSSFDSIVASTFPTPLYSFPFAFRSETSSSRSSYVLQGGMTSPINSNSSGFNVLDFSYTRFLLKPSVFSRYSQGFLVPSSNLGLVVASVPSHPSGGTINSASSYALSSCYLVPTLLVPSGLLPDVKVGDWISDSPEDLQKALTNEFNVDSGKLKDSKDSLNSWNSTSSVDSDVASGATGLLNGIFQNLGTFLFSVSLLCFGAVVLRMLIRKAVDG